MTAVFYVVRCLLCLGHTSAVDEGEPVAGIVADAEEHVRVRHPGAGAAVLEIEPGTPALGWTSSPGSPAAWFNEWYGSTFAGRGAA
ncbi:hypothetical protein [Streptomyces griseofuscus]|uniref:hypothetical protein n=1 Tax=Streptomyces griseofuscus TaxID=146922 RepID=UPI0033EB1650